MRLGVCAFFRNEARYLLEWIAFHRHVGVTDFYLYDHNSNDSSLELLRPLVDEGVVHLYVNGDHSVAQMQAAGVFQGRVIHHCMQTHRREVDWIMHIDIDEFLTPSAPALPGKTHMQTVLEPLDQTNVTGIYVFRLEFGPNNHRTPPQGLLQCEAYTTRMPKVSFPKWIIKYVHRFFYFRT
jgi:hypothetical protein